MSIVAPEKLRELKRLAAGFRIDALNATHKANSGHPTTAFSALEIMVAIYFGEIDGKKILNIDPKKPDWEDRDYFILSKGHGCPGLYPILAHLGFFEKERLNYLRQVGALLEGHPVWKIPGIEATTGPLGQGISFGNGIALANKIDKKKNRVYILCGDGETQEGQIWEAVMTSAQHQLDNLMVFIDHNKLQQTGALRGVKNVENLKEKFESFGWFGISVTNGHDFEEIHDAIRRGWKEQRRPTAIICETIKGKGIAFAQGNWTYHGKALSKEEMAEAIPVLEKEVEGLK